MSLFPNFGTIYCVNNPFSTFFITVAKRLLREFILTCTNIILMQYAPIIIFAFNRPDALKKSVDSLQKNVEANESDLYVFVDGPRPHKEGEAEQVQAVRDFVASLEGFKSITTRFSEVNKGLGPSIIAGVTEVMNKHGRAIVLEDDLILATNFLSFMNQSLEKYENVEEVFSVCGYSLRLNLPKDYAFDAYFCPRSSSWGWATWKDRWLSVDFKLEDWDAVERNGKQFNKWGGSDCFGMLKGWREGRNKSWAIRFVYSQFCQGKLSLFPHKSLVDNGGFDGNGTNCKSWSRYKCTMDITGKKAFRLPEEVSVNKVIRSSYLWYYGIPIRIWSRIMYAYTGLMSH